MKIMILEDDEMVARSTEAILNSLGYEATILFPDVKSFKSSIENGEPPDVVFLDWVLPDGQGIDVCTELRQKFSLTFPFIAMLTAKDRPHEIIMGFRAGANDYLLKPVTKSDIEKSLRVAKELQQLRATIQLQELKLVNSARLSSLGELAGNVAHEINNPLTILHERTDEVLRLLQEERLDREQLQRHCSGISHTTDRVSKIVNALQSLAVGERETIEFSSTSLSEVIDEAVALAAERFKNEGVELRNDQTGTPSVIGNRVQLGQVLINLLNNALFAVEGVPEKWIKIELGEKDGLARISVTDSGRGVPLELRQKIMEPFFSTRTKGKGTGLGLSLSKSIMEAHKGRLFLDEDSTSTRFVMELPSLNCNHDRK